MVLPKQNTLSAYRYKGGGDHLIKPRMTLIFINQPHEAICLTRHQQSSLLAAVRQGEKGYETAT